MPEAKNDSTAAVDFELNLDFDSDEPLPVCPMRKDGMADGEICESCQ